jgi:hypothetical protein
MKSKGLFVILFLLVSLLPAVGQDQTQVNIPQDAVEHLRTEANISYRVSTYTEEYAAVVLVDGEVQYFELPSEGGRFSIPVATKLLLHTHPKTGTSKPSDIDIATAKQIKVPNCVVTRSDIWCAMPDGRIEKLQ